MLSTSACSTTSCSSRQADLLIARLGNLRPAVRPFQSRPQQRCRGQQRVKAAADESSAANEALKISSKDIGPIPFPEDTETISEVMAFKGPAPERVNGRVAMWAFLICSITELTSGQTVIQQAIQHPVQATFLGLIISAASIVPKYVTGVSLEELQNTASREGLPENLRFFNKTHEIWVGRVAMIGLVGLVGVETFLGRALFHGA